MTSKFTLALLCSCLLFASWTLAEIKQSVTLNLVNTLAYNSDPLASEALFIGTGTGQLNLQSTGNKNVRGYLNLTMNTSDVFAVDRLYVKTRLDKFRFSMGKSRLSWGEGSVFNAGDVIMGGSDLNVDLTTSDYRSNSRWLVSVYKPLGRFSFAEIVIMPDEEQATGAGTIAARSQFRLESMGKTKLELGYSQAGNIRQPYFSLQGGKGLNWHLSGNWQSGSLNLSSGIYSLVALGENSTLNFRFELLHKSAGDSQEVIDGRNYQNYGYLELSLIKGSRASYFSRSILSPIDESAFIILGGNFNLHQGLNLYSHIAAQRGGRDDTFAQYSQGANSVTFGASYIF